MYTKKPFVEDSRASPAERRVIKRRHLIYYLRVWDRKKKSLLGHLADVSTDGFMLVGETPVTLKKEFDLEINLPAEEDKIESIHFKALSRWSSNDVNKLFYDTGFLFVDISPEAVQRINKLIEEYGFSDELPHP